MLHGARGTVNVGGRLRNGRDVVPAAIIRRSQFAVLVVVLAVAAFVQSTGHGFLFWDDRGFISENRLIAHPSAANLVTLWTRPLLDLYAPLTYSLWALLSVLFGPTPWVFHLTNVGLHAANAGLVFLLLRDLLDETDAGAALAGALVFAVHPIQTETVVWASETKDLLSAALSLVAIRGYVTSRREQNRSAYTVASIAFVGALLAKPSAVITRCSCWSSADLLPSLVRTCSPT
jgi:hypothetical protein